MSAMETEHGCWAPGHWLRHCEGYGVDSGEGRIGYVEEIVWAPDGREPVGLRVRGGAASAFRPLVISVEQIRELRPAAEQIVVDDAWTADPGEEEIRADVPRDRVPQRVDDVVELFGPTRRRRCHRRRGDGELLLDEERLPGRWEDVG